MSLKRTKRQIQAVRKWIINSGKGTLEFVTGVGKTNTAIIAIKKLVKLDPMLRVHIVVPTKYLKTQWEQEIIKSGLHLYHVWVCVINTYLKVPRECDFLILDEIHNYGSIKRLQVFKTKYHWLLGLTATMERRDMTHNVIQTYAPIIDRIDLEEAREEGYVSDYIVYNLGIELNEQDRELLDSYNKSFYKHFSYFGHDFNLAMKCMADKKAREHYAKVSGFEVDQIGFHAVRFNYFMQKRKNFLYNLPRKLELARDIIAKFKVKTITFSENINSADELTKIVPLALSYHSKISKKLREAHLHLFKQKEWNTLNTSKALDEGFDVGDIELAIITSSRAVNRVDIQRTGRAIRFKEGKLAVIVNLYVKNSKDEEWLRQRQQKDNNIYWIENVNDIKFERPERLKVKVGKSDGSWEH
jgi:superfamily II DNA or RNA helicase